MLLISISIKFIFQKIVQSLLVFVSPDRGHDLVGVGLLKDSIILHDVGELVHLHCCGKHWGNVLHWQVMILFLLGLLDLKSLPHYLLVLPRGLCTLHHSVSVQFLDRILKDLLCFWVSLNHCQSVIDVWVPCLHFESFKLLILYSFLQDWCLIYMR